MDHEDGSARKALEEHARQSVASLGAAMELPGFSADIVQAIERLRQSQEAAAERVTAAIEALREEYRRHNRGV